MDPATGQPAAAPQPEAPPQPPAVSGDVAAIMDKVIQTVESQARSFEEKSREQEQRISRLEQELASDKQVREERRKVIDTILPSL